MAQQSYAVSILHASRIRIHRNSGTIVSKCNNTELQEVRLSQAPFNRLSIAKTEMAPSYAGIKSQY